MDNIAQKDPDKQRNDRGQHQKATDDQCWDPGHQPGLDELHQDRYKKRSSDHKQDCSNDAEKAIG